MKHMMPKQHARFKAKPEKAAVMAAFHGMSEDEPAIVAKTRKKKGKKAARKQRVAIALSKARAASRMK